MIWLKKAGFHVSAAELVYLIDHGIKPTKDLLYEQNRLALSKKIYPYPVVIAQQLEHKMAHALSCFQVVNALMRLVQKGHVKLI